MHCAARPKPGRYACASTLAKAARVDKTFYFSHRTRFLKVLSTRAFCAWCRLRAPATRVGGIQRTVNKAAKHARRAAFSFFWVLFFLFALRMSLLGIRSGSAITAT